MTTLPSINPIVAAAAATLTDVGCNLMLIQWVDDAADIADDSDLVLTINGQTLTYKFQLEANAIDNCVVMQIGPFNPGIWVDNIIIDTIDKGELHVWFD